MKNTNMAIDDACDILESFADANHLDHLTALEVMVKHYRIISDTERIALNTFMDYGRKNDNRLLEVL